MLRNYIATHRVSADRLSPVEMNEYRPLFRLDHMFEPVDSLFHFNVVEVYASIDR